jgi:hypothetical protein
MSRAYVLVRLLQHGPMTLHRIVEVCGCGWDYDQTGIYLLRLQRAGIVRASAVYRSEYRLTMDVDEALRRLRPSTQRRALLRKVQPGMPHLRGPVPVVPAAHANPTGAKARTAAQGAGRLDGVRTSRAAAARAGGAGLGGLGS